MVRCRGSGLGIELMLELDAAMERVAASPESCAREYGEVRRVLMRRFPYAIYLIFEDEVIEVLAVLHQHRDQSSLRSRLGHGKD